MFERFKRKEPVEELLQAVDEADTAPYLTEPSRQKSRKDRKQQVLDYVKAHEGKVIRNGDIAEELGITDSYASTLLTDLARSQTISRRGKGKNRKFRVNHQRVIDRKTKPTKVMEKPLQLKDAEKVEHELNETAAALASMEELVIEFVKDTRCTDVLHFLSWLEGREISKTLEEK